MSDARERKVEHLMEALDENTKSKALLAAADYPIRMRGGTTAVPTGRIAELMKRAEEQGSATPKEIAEVLDTDQISVNYAQNWTVESNE